MAKAPMPKRAGINNEVFCCRYKDRYYHRVCTGCGRISLSRKRDLSKICKECSYKTRAGKPIIGPSIAEEHLLYSTWTGMKSRCTNSNVHTYKYYGGRGIKVCDHWYRDFWSFVEDMGERPNNTTLDRIDNERDYTPENCRWATKSEQNKNKRPSCRIPEETIMLILEDPCSGAEAARKYNVTAAYVSLLRRGKSRKALSGFYSFRKQELEAI